MNYILKTPSVRQIYCSSTLQDYEAESFLGNQGVSRGFCERTLIRLCAVEFVERFKNDPSGNECPKNRKICQ